MFKYLTVLICTLTIGKASAQTEKELVGIWKVSDVSLDKSSPYADNPMFLKLKAGMLGSEFNMRADHHFILKNNVKNAPQTQEGIWHYNKAKKLVDVGELVKTQNKLMYFMVAKDAQGNTLFKSVDIPLILKVHK